MEKLSELMASRICDLGLNLKKSHLYPRVLQLYDELHARGLKFRPVCYFADEWFVPEGEPAIGIPFYLANTSLMHLERKMMGEVEGETYLYFMKLLRHEAGHAITYAFQLNKKKGYRKIFGFSHKLFTDIYKYNKRSKKHVIHLREHYAQSHPDEDFAETFAVWLTMPEEKWQRKYKRWKALKKIEYVDKLMKEIMDKKSRTPVRDKMCHVSSLRYTVWTYYMRRRALVAHQRGKKS